jgi:hypothetical protein
LIYTFSNISECKNLKYYLNECEDYFYKQIGFQKLDSQYCDKLHDSTQKTPCLNSLQYKSAVKNNDPSFCSKIVGDETFKKNCNIVFQDRIAESAKEATSTNIAKVAEQSNNPDLCKKLNTADEKINCITPMINSTLDTSICNRVFSDAKSISNCLTKVSFDFDRMIIRKAFNDKNLSLCSKLSQAKDRNLCMTMKFN